MPGSRPSSTARVMASVPKRSRTSSTTRSSALARSSGSASWTALSLVRLLSVMPMRVIPLRSMSGMAPASSPRSVARIVRVREVASAMVCERVAREKSSKRRRSVIVRQTRRAARRRPPSRSTSPTSAASSESCVHGLRPSARCAPIERRRRRRSTGRGSRLCASAWSLRPDARPSMSTSAASGSRATSATSVMPRSRSFWAVTAPTPQRRSTGSGCRKSSSPPGGTRSSPSGFATALATFARNLVFAMPTVIGSPTSLAHLAPELAGDLERRALEPLHPTRVEERLVDRDRLHVGRGLLEHLEHRPARLRVGLHARRHDHGVGTEPLREAAAHRRPHAARLGLVAAGEHHPAPTITGLPRSRRSSRCSTDA